MSVHESSTATSSAAAFAPGAAWTWRTGLTSGAAALAANAVVFAVARAAAPTCWCAVRSASRPWPSAWGRWRP